MVTLTIHRGTNEIGGSCLELATREGRILIDIGERLEPFGKIAGGSTKETPQALPLSLDRSISQGPAIDGVIISHPHRDHFGLLHLLPPSIPVYMSRGCETMMNVSAYFGLTNKMVKPPVIIESWKKFSLGGFNITSFLMDHSAIDSLAFLIETKEKKIFYSGDLRAHGRKHVTFDTLVSSPPEGIDYLILEGTLVGRRSSAGISETGVERKMVKHLRESDNLCLVNCSSQNIDRMVTLYRSCIRSGRTLVIDPYTARILDEVNKIHPKVPGWNWDGIKIFFSKNIHTQVLARNGDLFKYAGSKITLEQIINRKNRLLVKLNSSIRRKFLEHRVLDNASLIWSQWEGYFSSEAKFWNDEGVNPSYIHSSGHARISDLQKLVKAISPVNIVPVHTTCKFDYKSIFPSSPVMVLHDGIPVVL